MNNLNDLLLNPGTKAAAAAYIRQPAPALLITAPAGSGKKLIAGRMLAACLRLEPNKLNNYPYFLKISPLPDKQEISIDSVRELKTFLKLKIPGQAPIKRAVLITPAEKLSAEAQNSLLKVLEEPNDDCLLVLTAAAASGLLATVASRCQIIQINPVSLGQASDYFGKSYSRAQIASAWRLSGGQAGLLNALLGGDDGGHPLANVVGQCKQFLRLDSYERQIFLNKIAAKKEEFELFLTALSKILAALLGAAANKNPSVAAKLLADRRLVGQTAAALANNTSAKLLALNLAQGLKN